MHVGADKIWLVVNINEGATEQCRKNAHRQYTVQPTRFYWSAEVIIQYFRLGFGDATIEQISHGRYNNSAV